MQGGGMNLHAEFETIVEAAARCAAKLESEHRMGFHREGPQRLGCRLCKEQGPTRCLSPLVHALDPVTVLRRAFARVMRESQWNEDGTPVAYGHRMGALKTLFNAEQYLLEQRREKE
jgi:hypothetical protein